jgi:ATP-binding cassette subfamily B protein
MRDFLDYETKIVGGDIEPADFESLEFRNVSFRYEGNDKNTLSNVSFRINKGETFAVVGHNGAGKTTLSKLIMRLYDVTEGEILYNGKNIKEYNLLSYRDRYASVFQDYRIFAMTVAENVLMQETDENNIPLAEKALTQSGVMNKIETLPEGVNTLLTKEFDDEGASLSGGETQKLAIARLFAKQFDVAVLDEPSSALDPVAESKMYDALAEGTKDKTVLYISHRLSSAANADNILVFRDGQLIETGNHAELMEKGGEYCEMFTLQASGYREEESQDESD